MTETLHYETWHCALLPAFGGGITALRCGGRDIFRPSPLTVEEPFALSNFVLLPYANRIADGRVSFAGVEAILPVNVAGENHPLHGVGFLAAWAVEARTDRMITLLFEHAPSPAWPWAFRARQTVTLSERGYHHALEVTNTHTAPAPMGLGFHPYFPFARGARLKAKLKGVWLADAQQLPTRHQERPLRDWSNGAAVQGVSLIDHCHTGWEGTAFITWPDGDLGLTLRASANLDRLHIYAPPDEDFFCLEPVSHRPDAINAHAPFDEGLCLLAPGETLSAWMAITHTIDDA
jgi:aldose 1-epimerase